MGRALVLQWLEHLTHVWRATWVQIGPVGLSRMSPFPVSLLSRKRITGSVKTQKTTKTQLNKLLFM